jgi:hypothetical protein
MKYFTSILPLDWRVLHYGYNWRKSLQWMKNITACLPLLEKSVQGMKSVSLDSFMPRANPHKGCEVRWLLYDYWRGLLWDSFMAKASLFRNSNVYPTLMSKEKRSRRGRLREHRLQWVRRWGAKAHRLQWTLELTNEKFSLSKFIFPFW